MILGRFWGGAVALGTRSIYLRDLQKKVQGGLGLSRNSLVLDVLSTTFLFGLDTDGRPEAVAEQADQDRLQDHHVDIEFLEDGL